MVACGVEVNLSLSVMVSKYICNTARNKTYIKTHPVAFSFLDIRLM